MTPNVTDIITKIYEVFWSFVDSALPMAYGMLVATVIFTFASLVMLSCVSTLCVLTITILYPDQKVKRIKLAFQGILKEVVDEIVGKEAKE